MTNDALLDPRVLEEALKNVRKLQAELEHASFLMAPGAILSDDEAMQVARNYASACVHAEVLQNNIDNLLDLAARQIAKLKG